MYIWILITIIAVAIYAVIEIRRKKLLHGEVFRKFLHFIAIFLMSAWVYFSPTWQLSVNGIVLLLLLGYPTFIIMERTTWFDKFLAARKRGELAMSLLLVGAMFIIVTYVGREHFDSKLLTITSIYAWGPGDAAAALFGSKFGRHKIGPGKVKSLEGTLAMFVVSFACVAIMLGVFSDISMGIVLLTSALTAIGAAISELYSKNGNDTIICPLVSMAILVAVLYSTGNIAVAH